HSGSVSVPASVLYRQSHASGCPRPPCRISDEHQRSQDRLSDFRPGRGLRGYRRCVVAALDASLPLGRTEPCHRRLHHRRARRHGEPLGRPDRRRRYRPDREPQRLFHRLGNEADCVLHRFPPGAAGAPGRIVWSQRLREGWRMSTRNARFIDKALGLPGVLTLLALAALFPAFVTDTYALHFLWKILFWAVVASAWNMAGGYAGQFSLGH